MTLQIYERLSEVYDLEWGRWSPRYAALIDEVLAPTPVKAARILDLACGTGSLAIELAKVGATVLGIDVSPGMIAIARTKAAAFPKVSFRVADMQQFSPDAEFDCVTCTYDSINYLVSDGQLHSFAAMVESALVPGGFVILDSTTERMYLNHGKGTHHRELGGVSFVHRYDYDAESHRATTVFEFSDGTEEVHVQRPYSLEQIGPALEQAHLTIVKTMSGFDGRQFTAASEQLICIARR